MRKVCGREHTAMTQGHEQAEQHFGQTLSDFSPITVIAFLFLAFFQFQC